MHKRVNIQVSELGPPDLKRMGRSGGTVKGDREGAAEKVGGEPGVGCPGSQVKKASRTMSPDLI